MANWKSTHFQLAEVENTPMHKMINIQCGWCVCVCYLQQWVGLFPLGEEFRENSHLCLGVPGQQVVTRAKSFLMEGNGEEGGRTKAVAAAPSWLMDEARLTSPCPDAILGILMVCILPIALNLVLEGRRQNMLSSCSSAEK